MFDVGFQELTLLGVIALIVVGPERLPRMARTLGLWMGKIRYYVGQVKSDIEREVRAQELKEMLNKPADELDDLYKVAEETKGTLDQAKDALGEAKAALDGTPAGISTPNEPAAGSIFPTELPGAGPARDATAPARSSKAPAAPSPESVPVATEPEEAASAQPDGAEPASAPARSPEAPAAPSPESAPVATEPEEAASAQPEGAEPGRSNALRVAKDTRESHERASESV